jgi:hypothetical protein
MPIPQCGFDIGWWADLASILTAAVAVFWFSYTVLDRCRKRRKLEDYLLKKWRAYDPKTDKGDYRHTIVHLMTELGLTEDEVLQASFRSVKIKRKAGEDESGLATDIRLQHRDAADF